MLLQADNGTVQDCTVDGSAIAGIVLMPEGLHLDQSGYSQNVVIERNTIRNTGHSYAGGSGDIGAALTITGTSDPRRRDAGPQGNRNITIDSNVFDSICGCNLQVQYARSVSIKNNVFQNTHQNPCNNGDKIPTFDSHAMIWMEDVGDVTLSGNRVSNMGPYGTSLLALGHNTMDLQGVTDGIALRDKLLDNPTH